jgi:hypothetical protein
MTRPRRIETEDHVKALVKEWFEARDAWSYAPIQNGLGEHGIPDRVGCVPVVVTPEMVGKRIGLFVSVECKKPGRRSEPSRGMSKHQELVMDAVRAAHGISEVVDGENDLASIDWELNMLITRRG